MKSNHPKKSASDIQREKKLKEKAEALFGQGKMDKALPLFLDWTKHNPQDLRIKMKIGDIYCKLGNVDQACNVYREVAAQYAADQQMVKAIAVKKMILKINPREEGLLKDLTDLYGSQKTQEVTKRFGNTPTGIRRIEVVGPPSNPITETRANPPPPEPQEPPMLSGERVFDPDSLTITQEDAVVDLEAVSEVTVPPTPLFSDLSPQALERVINLLHHKTFAPGATVCAEGETGDSIFVISDGKMEVSTKDSAGQKVILATLGDGDFFGEFAYFSDHKRHATIKTLTDSVILELDHATLDSLVREFPEMQGVLQKFYQTRLLETVMAKSRIFSPLSAQQRQILARKFEAETHDEGYVLMHEGDPGDSMYLIEAGKLRVATNKNGKPVELAVLREGHFCGEFAILTNAKRTADVTCVTQTKLLRLSKEAAMEFFRAYPQVKALLNEIAQERVTNTIRAMQFREAK